MKADFAEEAVKQLGLQSAIEENIDLLYARLKEALESSERRAAKLERMGALLPTVSIFINYASTRAKLTAALQWLRAEWAITTRDEAMSTLATLILICIVDTGFKKHAADAEKLTVWEQIQDDVTAAAEELASAPVQH